MGQLERYGLYVLCLVIFLILGVAIWGGDPQAAVNSGSLSAELEELSSPNVRGAESDAQQEEATGESLTLSQMLDLNKATGPAAVTGPPGEEVQTEKEEVAPPKPQPEPTSAPEVRYYVVKNGDILSEIAQRELGTSTRWREIQALNPDVKERNLKLGTKLRLPARGSRPSAGTQGWFLYTVKKHDNYSKISLNLYGTQAFASAIVALNEGVDPLKLREGQEIRVPLRK